MTDPAPPRPDPAPTVSRARYDRERRARQEAESLLEAKSRELYVVNQRLMRQAEALEQAVRDRTADLEAARAQAEAASAAKSVFLASMSHEIRTPLNGVLGMAAALGDTPLSVAQRDMLAVIIDSGDMLLSVLNDILDLSKIEAGRFELEDVPFDLAEAVRSVERMHALKAEEKGLDFGVQVRGAGWVRGDPNRLRQVLGNLVSNAIKFTERGLVRVLADLSPPDAAGGVLLRLVVADTGQGIGDDRMAQLFTPYAQGGPAVARQYGGTGLGLSIARQFCRMMGGDLTAESRPGFGSTFTATVRLAVAEAPPLAQPGAVERDFAERLRRQPLSILAAEDNGTNQLVLKGLLRRFDLRVDIVPNGRVAVEAWHRDRPDLILMDVQMPLMNGIEATQAIRRAEAEARRPRTPIIALSANAMRHQIEEYLAVGMDGNVTKPIRRAELIEAIVAVLPRPAPAARACDRPDAVCTPRAG
ncbi:MAG: response regulator [Rhodobacterales bacterium]|nr:response regulator [Rhodobacterales bacterium]